MPDRGTDDKYAKAEGFSLTMIKGSSVQARRLAAVLQEAGISAKVVGRDTTHEGLNDEIGEPNDPVTKEVFAFIAMALKR